MRPAVISFYSYKGGVGRSLLAANMAVALAREGKTLLWDMDVEAPGLHHIQALRNPGPVQAGFFDWLLDWQTNKLRPPGPQDLSGFSKLVQATPFSQLFLLPAHGVDADPAALYYGIDWGHLLGGNPPPALHVFQALIEHLGQQGFRHVLIDTRTGLTDLGALLAGALPDATVLVGGYGQQNLRGLGRVYQALSELDANVRPSNTALRLFPVASPIPQDDADRVAAGRRLWSQTLGVADIASVREIRYDTALPFSEELLITQPERAIAQDYEKLYGDLSAFIATLFAAEEAEQAALDARPDIFERDPADPRSSRPAQGKRFEDRVADLLRLLGYSVEREQLIGPDRVDLIARIESGLDTNTYFVECKDHKSAVSKEVVDLLGLWLSRPEAQALQARGMVVAHAFSPAALASAKTLGITTATPMDMERRLLDVDKYLFQLVADFEQTPLARSYVTQRGLSESSPVERRRAAHPAHKDDPQHATARHPIDDLLAHGMAWAQGRDSRLWVLLGDYGTGKTAFTEKLAYELAKRAMADHSAPVPLRVSLRDFPNKVRLDELLAERWLQASGQRKDPRVLLHLVQRGRIVLLFDAFDEMGIATAGRSVVEQFRMLVALTAKPGDTATGNRVLITCREQFFKDHGELLKAAAGEQDRIASSPLQELTQRFDGAIHTVATFTPEQVREYLVLRLGQAAGEAALQFLRDQGLMELGDRPQLLDIIIASLPALQEQQARSGQPLSAGALYQTYTNQWLDEFKPVERQSSSALLRSVLEELALLLWQRVGNRMHYGDLFALVKQRVDLRGQLDPHQLDIELRTAAFLSRTPDGLYGFSHRSFLEFFLARRIERSACDSQAGDVAKVLSIPRLNTEAMQFLHDLVPVQDSGRRAALKAAVRGLLAPGQPQAAAADARVNALLLGYWLPQLEITLLVVGQDKLTSWLPEGPDLAGLDLSDLPLFALSAPGADFSQSVLKGCDLSGADLRGTNFNQANLRHATLSSADLREAQMKGAVASDVTAMNADLRGVQAQGSVWLNADLQAAELEGADFSKADLRAAHLALCQGVPLLDQARTQGLTARHACGWTGAKQVLADPPLKELVLAPDAAHVGAANAVAFSPYGHRMVSAGKDGTLRLWDTDSGQMLCVMHGHDDSAHCVTFSPDGHHIASSHEDGKLRIWNTESGQLLRVMQGHQGPARSLAFSPDGRHIASGGGDDTLRLWDALSGRALGVMTGHEDWVRSVAFSPDGQLIASSSYDGTVRLWNPSTSRALRHIKVHEGDVPSVVFSPDGRRIASGSSDGKLCLWDCATGQPVMVMQGHENGLRGLAFSPDGRHIASAEAAESLRLWDAKTGQTLRTLMGHEEWVNSVAFSPDGLRLASAGDDALRLWSIESGESLRVIAGQDKWLHSVAVSPDGRHIANSEIDGTLQLWDADSGRMLRRLHGHQSPLQDATFSPDGSHIATGGHDGTVRLWDAATGQLLHVMHGHQGWVQSVAFSPDGCRIVSGGNDKTMRLWNTDSGQPLHVMKAHGNWVSNVAFSPDGRHVASVSNDTPRLWDTPFTLRLWDTVSEQTVCEMRGHESWVRCIAFSPDGAYLASASDDGALRLWDIASGQTLRAMQGHESPVAGIAFSPDGRQLASASRDGTLRLWDTRTGETVRVMQGHLGRVNRVAFSPDSRHLASGGQDGTVRLWTTEGQEVLRMRARSSAKGDQAALIPEAAPNWVTLDFRQDPRGRWSGQGEVVDTVRYVDATQAPQPWPWVPRYWRASDLPELHVDAPTGKARSSARKTTAKRKIAARPPKEDKGPA